MSWLSRALGMESYNKDAQQASKEAAEVGNQMALDALAASREQFESSQSFQQKMFEWQIGQAQAMEYGKNSAEARASMEKQKLLFYGRQGMSSTNRTQDPFTGKSMITVDPLLKRGGYLGSDEEARAAASASMGSAGEGYNLMAKANEYKKNQIAESTAKLASLQSTIDENERKRKALMGIS